ncbi:MAG TPA: DUF3857 domain-containing protein [Ignavibacteriales bacterium]|nr:DUF3857 domain-containing protein [Ignavibacteriales bacterium]
MNTTGRSFLFGLLIFSGSLLSSAKAEDNQFDTRKIPAFLKKDAGAVIRENFIRFEVKNEKRALEKVKRAVTIFNKDEQHFGQLVLWYDKFTRVESLEGRILDKFGEEVRELEDNDVKDVSAFSNYSLYEDNRVREAELYYDRFPYTVEYTYEISYDGYLNWPEWYSQESLEPVEISRFEVLMPEGESLRYWTNADSVKPRITSEGGRNLYVWEAKNLPLLSKDVIGDDLEDIAQIVHIAPDNFELDGYKGSMRTWKDFGSWVYNLFKDRGILPDAAVSDVKAIVSKSTDKTELIRSLYHYMQRRTRYVSVQLGIGGFQPFDAKYVHEKGYGDCKALSNYMVSLLKEAGIKAFPVLIKTGLHRRPMISEFPSSQFNHVIVCVPMDKDTMWLECTNQSTPPGYLGNETENRQALMLTELGGVVVQTPKSTSTENLQSRKLNVELTSLGSLYVNAEIKWTGNQQEVPRSLIKESTPEEREKWIINSLETPLARLEQIKASKSEDDRPEVRMDLKLTLPNYGSASGSRIFFQPNIMERRTTLPKDVKLRLSPIRFYFPYLDADTVYFKIPQGFRLEALPQETLLKAPYGNFSSKTMQLDKDTLIYTRRLEISSYSIEAKSYNEYRKFIEAVVKSDRSQVVLVK